MAQRITSVSDTPLIQDPNDFGTKRYVDGLVEFIKHSVSPLTIALQGEWGSGKTSLMNRLEARLCGDKSEFIGININTWEYSMLATPEETVLKIIVQLVKSLSGDDPNTAEKLKNFAKNTVNFLWRGLREFGKDVVPGAGVVIEAANAPNQIFSSEGSGENVSLAELKESLEAAVDKQLGNGKKGVLVFVDDLDRLNPPVAVEILELLKNIFNLKGCIFILAIDYEVVVKGLEPKFGKLTDKNEREFRSFFDKIIQVPFSLPVSNYQPKSFLMEQLQEIGYVNNSDVNLHYSQLSDTFTEIVDKTIGKNPRSIKRLINSLSLIKCISDIEDGSSDKAPLISPESISGKIINFAVIALQISYPRIYNVLMQQPDFKQWDWDTARRFKASVPENIKTETPGNETIWESVLSAICETDSYLKAHETDIKEVIELIAKEIADNCQSEEPGKVLSEFLKRSSVTGVGGFRDTADINYPQIVRQLHSNVVAAMASKHKDWKFSSRKATNCGGFNIWPVGKQLQTKLSPCELNNGRVSMRLEMPTSINVNNYPNIKRVLDLGFHEAMKDPGFNQLIDDFDAVVTPLLGKEWFKGSTLRTRLSEQWLKNGNWENLKRFFRDTTFDFTLLNSAGFEQAEVIDAMVAMHEAVCNLHVNAKNLR